MASKNNLVRQQSKSARRKRTHSTSLDRFGRKSAQVFLLLILVSALWVILSRRYDESTLRWAIGTIGVVVGQWVRLT